MANPKILPNMTARELIDAAWDRLTEWYIFDTRTNRIGNKDVIQWKDRILTNDAMYRGDWVVGLPNETSVTDIPIVQNIIQVAADDLARLTVDNVPAVYSPPLGDKDSDITAARVREMILRTYWQKGGGEQLRSWLTLDLALTGAAFLAVVPPKSKKEYPTPFRIDPRGCFPDILNGELQDLIVTQRIRARQAEVMMGIDLNSAFGVKVSAGNYEDIEIIDYYHPMGMVRVLTAVSNNEPIGAPFLYDSTRYDLDCPPVAFSMLPTGDGQFRGLYDQIRGILGAQNRLATLMRDYMDQAVYAPWFEFNVENNTEKPGPRTIYHGMDERSKMERVQPAISSPQVYEQLDFYDRSARAGAARPQSREGEVSQSQDSGAFIDSTQGAFTTVTRDIGRKLADVQQDWNHIALQLDERFGNTEKTLWRPVGKQYTYTPKKDIAGVYENEVVYGTGAGLSYLNRKAAIFQEVGARFISRDTARGMMDDIPDAEAERVKIDREEAKDAYMQRLVNQDDPTDLEGIIKLMADGSDFFMAAAKYLDAKQAAQEQAMQQQQQQPAQPGAPEQPSNVTQLQTTPQGAPQGPATPPAPPWTPQTALPTAAQIGR